MSDFTLALCTSFGILVINVKDLTSNSRNFFLSELHFVAGAESTFFRCHIQMQCRTRLLPCDNPARFTMLSQLARHKPWFLAIPKVPFKVSGKHSNVGLKHSQSEWCSMLLPGNEMQFHRRFGYPFWLPKCLDSTTPSRRTHTICCGTDGKFNTSSVPIVTTPKLKSFNLLKARGERSYDIFSRLLKERIICLNGNVSAIS
jgi:hypothetical protein